MTIKDVKILMNANDPDAAVLVESVSTQTVLFTVSANRVSQFLQMAVHVKVRETVRRPIIIS